VGAIEFNIAVRVTMDESSDWRPDRIAAFFGGVAQVKCVGTCPGACYE